MNNLKSIRFHISANLDIFRLVLKKKDIEDDCLLVYGETQSYRRVRTNKQNIHYFHLLKSLL